MATATNAFGGSGLSRAATMAIIDGQTGINVKTYGATGDARKVTDAVLNGTTTVTSATAAFTSADVGKVIWGVETATGNLRLAKTTIAAVNSATSITVASAAVGTYSNIHLIFGTDHTTYLQAAFTAAKAAKANVILPAGGYLVSALPFDGNRSTVGNASGVIGSGSNATTIFVTPDYNFASTTSNTGIIYRVNGNCRQAEFKGVYIESGYYTHSGSGYHVIGDSGADHTTIDDVRIWGMRGFTSNLYSVGTTLNVRRCRFEASNYIGINLGGGSACFEDCYTGNHGFWGLYVLDFAGSGNTGISFRWTNGIIDESGGSSCYISNSTDAVFIGARCFGPVSLYAVELASSSQARFVGCEMVGYGASGNRGGLKVNSGCTAILSNCRLHGLGTLYGLDNAGTVYDGGGNVSNNKTGAGTISVPAL